MRTYHLLITAGALLLATIAGCAQNDPVRVESDFGNSVRHMVKMQIYNPKAAENPSTTPPLVLDGPVGQQILNNYRGATGKQEAVKQPIIFNVP